VRGDTDGLRRLATTTRLQADRVRLLALKVRAVGAVRWRSPAADSYRTQVEARARRLEREAEDAHELARSLDALADALEGVRSS
jgi:hypothetical protein